jgi:prepilin-type N-terminal cleavage/methylation domain-containing protein
MNRRSSFTLIEMLVVIAVIGIMTGIVFKLFSMVTRKGEEAECMKRLESIANALNEYFAEYGQYPPVSGMGYVCEDTGRQHANFRDNFLPQNPSWNGNTLFDYGGLVAWLWPRNEPYNHAAWPMLWDSGNGGYSILHKNNVQYIGDTARDLAAKERWAHFLEDVPVSRGWDERTNNLVTSGNSQFAWPYTNTVRTVNDPWGRSLKYVCAAPYMSYKLWSVGPDGTNGTPDDIHRDKWDM